MRHIICLLIENEPGALARVAGLFTARGYNIESLSVAPTDDETVSRMTLVTTGDETIVEQIVKQLNKLIEVIKLVDVTGGAHVERELMLVKVQADTAATRDEIARLATAFRGRLIDVDRTTMILEAVGSSEKLAALVDAIDDSAILEVVRSGPCAIARGAKALRI